MTVYVFWKDPVLTSGGQQFKGIHLNKICVQKTRQACHLGALMAIDEALHSRKWNMDVWWITLRPFMMRLRCLILKTVSSMFL